MKNLVKSLFVMMIAIVVTSTVNAQIPGKIYYPGDTIKMDDVTFLVFKVDDTGMHGSALSPYARSSEAIEKLKKKTLKKLKKNVKKGEMTQDELDDRILQIEAIHKIPFVPIEDSKNGYDFRVDNWYKEAPQGWRLPTSKDAEDFAVFFCGGLGMNNAKFNLLGQPKKVTSDELHQSNLFDIIFKSGMIVCDSDKPDDVRFMARYITNGFKGFKDYLEIKDTFRAGVLTVAIKDF